MTSIIVAFFVSLAVSTVLTPLVLKMASTRELFDRPDGRKVHSRLVPRLGGIAIVLAFFVPLVGLVFVEAGMKHALTQNASQLGGLFAGGIAIALLGLYDDLRGANARQKFVVQIAVACLMWALDYRIESVADPFGAGRIDLGLFSVPLTVLWFVGVMNAVNLIDGLDGLAGGIGLISVSTLAALAMMDGNVVAALMCACLAGSLLGFLFFNFNPARIFMGDTGSLFLGFVLAAFSISTQAKGSTALALTVPILVLGLPIVDTMLAIGRRVKARRNIFSADQEHIHHKLLKAGFSHRGAVLVLYAVAALFGGLALWSRSNPRAVSGVMFIAAALILILLLRFIAGRRRSPRGLDDPFGEQGLEARAALDATADRLEGTLSRSDLATELEALAAKTNCLSVVLLEAERALYVYDRRPTPHEAMRPLGSYQIPLAPNAGLELRFAREADSDGIADLSVVLPWERVRPALADALERLKWPTLQEPVPALPIHDRPPVPLPAIDPLPAWARAGTKEA